MKAKEKEEKMDNPGWRWEKLDWGQLTAKSRCFSTAVRGSKLYLFGGYFNESSCSNSLTIIDFGKLRDTTHF